MPFIFAMKYVALFVGFLAAGITFILAGFYLRYLRTIQFGAGSCPASPNLPSDITLWLTSCYINQLALLLFWVGVAFLIAALIIGLYGYLSGRKNAKLAKIEPNPTQVSP